MKLIILFLCLTASIGFSYANNNHMVVQNEGELGDARCSVESVEFANSVQLKEIFTGTFL